MSDMFMSGKARPGFLRHCNMHSCKNPVQITRAASEEIENENAIKDGWIGLPDGVLCPVCAAQWDGVSPVDWYGTHYKNNVDNRCLGDSVLADG